MRPYIVRLMSDLREARIRAEKLRRLAHAPADRRNDTYAERRKRHEACAELDRVSDEDRDLLREFRKLGVRVGDVLRGEMLFPCLVDNREAFFIWFDGQEQPSHWRFRGEGELHAIPSKWFSMPLTDRRRPRVRGRIS